MSLHQYDPQKVIDIREYRDFSPFYSLEFSGLSRLLPVVPVDASLWLVSNESLCFGCDIGFTKKASLELGERLRPFCFDYIVCPETKALSFAYEICHLLSIPEFIIVLKAAKKGVHIAFSESMTSITSASPQFLFLDDSSAKKLEGKRVVLLDDTISTGGTMRGMLNLMKKARAEVVAAAAIWLEGPSYYQELSDFILTERLVYLDTLPIYSTDEQYDILLREKERVVWQHQTLSSMQKQRGFHFNWPSEKKKMIQPDPGFVEPSLPFRGGRPRGNLHAQPSL